MSETNSSILFETRNVSQRFGSFQALTGVSIQVRRGQILALIGPNGAGKSTLLNVLAGVNSPASGTVHFDGQDITSQPVNKRARMGIGRSHQVVRLFGELTSQQVAQLAVQRDMGVWSWLTSRGRMRVAERAHDLLKTYSLDEYADQPTGTLAHGIQKRLEIALALANNAPLLLLDEPMAGLTSSERESLAATLRQLARDHAIVFVEHDIDMVMALADRVCVLHNGELIAEGTPTEVKENPQVQSVYLHRAADA